MCMCWSLTPVIIFRPSIHFDIWLFMIPLLYNDWLTWVWRQDVDILLSGDSCFNNIKEQSLNRLSYRITLYISRLYNHGQLV